MEEQDRELEEKIIVSKQGKARRFMISLGLVMILGLGIFFFVIFHKYDSYVIDTTLSLENAQRTHYEDFNQQLLSYNLDGASFMNYQGEAIWNISYEMQAPCVDKQDTCALIYDKQGTLMKIVTESGLEGTIRTTLPITSASISDQQTVAVIMQDEDIAHINLYNAQGDLLATGEMRLTDSGYPIALALSSDGTKLAVSSLHLLEGNTKSEIVFFDFTVDDKKYENHRVGTYSYSNMVIPKIAFVEHNKLLAFGDSEIMVFGNQTEPKLEKEKFFSSEIKSIFYNKEFFGLILSNTNDEGEVNNIIQAYNMNGRERMSVTIDQPYTACKLLDNNEILLTDGKTTSLYSLFGIRKFSYSFDEDIQDIFSAKGLKKYYLIQDEQILSIQLH